MEKPLHGCRRGLRRKVPEENEPLHDSAKGCDAQAAFLGLGSPSASYRNLARRNRYATKSRLLACLFYH